MSFRPTGARAELSPEDRAIVDRTSDFVRTKLAGEPTGHDWWHAQRVRRLAHQIAVDEGADVLIVDIAALLHDVATTNSSKMRKSAIGSPASGWPRSASSEALSTPSAASSPECRTGVPRSRTSLCHWKDIVSVMPTGWTQWGRSA